MASTAQTAPKAAAGKGGSAQALADRLVIFGITGDLAKVMTFHSLYRLEARGLLDCPIVGVAGDDWSIDHLRKHARTSIEACGETHRRGRVRPVRGAALLSPATSPSDGHLRAGGRGDRATRSTPSSTSRSRLPVRQGRSGDLSEAGLTGRRPGGRREAVRPRPGLGPRARGRDPPVHRRVPAVPDRPLPRQDGHRRAAVPALRQHDDRADLEPQPHRIGADHDGRGLRRRGPRALLRPGGRAARRGRQPPDAARGGRGHGGRRPAATRKR